MEVEDNRNHALEKKVSNLGIGDLVRFGGMILMVMPHIKGWAGVSDEVILFTDITKHRFLRHVKHKGLQDLYGKKIDGGVGTFRWPGEVPKMTRATVVEVVNAKLVVEPWPIKKV